MFHAASLKKVATRKGGSASRLLLEASSERQESTYVEGLCLVLDTVLRLCADVGELREQRQVLRHLLVHAERVLAVLLHERGIRRFAACDIEIALAVVQ